MTPELIKLLQDTSIKHPKDLQLTEVSQALYEQAYEFLMNKYGGAMGGMPGECVYCERGERCVMHGKSGFLAGRLGHTAWCSHMVDGKTCNCGASFPVDGEVNGR